MLSIIVPTRSPEKLAAITAHYHLLFADHPHEIVPILNPPSMCRAYNEGLDRSTGELLVFSHDDIEALEPATFATRLLKHLESFDVVGVAGTSRLCRSGWVVAGMPDIFGQVLHPLPDGRFCLSIYGTPARINPRIQAMDGLFLAFRRPCIEAIRWDDVTFDHFHHYDIDTTFRAHLAGYRLAVACDLHVYHQSGGSFDDTWNRYAERFLQKHGPRLAPLLHGSIQFAARVVHSRQEGLALMTPPHWPTA
jgi:GT2 family glycosyltransferase